VTLARARSSTTEDRRDVSRTPKRERRRGPTTYSDGDPPMLWTILIILLIIALAVFILSRVRGGRRGL